MRKLLLDIIALCTVSATIITSSASASFNPNKDPNGDGNLNLNDYVYIEQYLYGQHEPSNLSQLDVDDNDVVSTVDSTYILMYDAGIISNSNSGDSNNRSVISKNYRVYDAQTGAYKRSYTLSVPEDNNNTNHFDFQPEESRGIVGSTDDRIPDWSNRGAAKIMWNGEAGYRGSGFVVNTQVIATAAHVVFNTANDTGYALSNVLLFNSDQTSVSLTPVEYHVPESFVNSSSYTSVDDYALITVENNTSINFNNYNSFNLGAITDSAATNNLTVATVGFPQYIYSNIESSTSYTKTLINSGIYHDERLSTGSVTYANSKIFRFTADTSGGNSGGPIYAVEILNGTTYHTVIGINVSQPSLMNAPYNTGVRFDALILKFYQSNSNLQFT